MGSAHLTENRPLSHDLATRHVLFVDADASVREVMREALERMGAIVRLAADSPTAVRLLEQESFDVMVIEWARWAEPRRRLALFAIQAQPSTGLVLVDGGGDAPTTPEHAVWITKPFTPSVLAEVIEEAIARKRRGPSRARPNGPAT